MKIFNIILSIFIFILAAASAVFSYFLFEKRAQFVSGHEKMARAIYESSKALDAGSGTDEAQKLTPEALAHDKYADLDSLLPGLPNQSKKIIAQRNALAQSLWNIGDAIQMKNLGEIDNFRKAETYSGRMDAVVSEVATTIKRRDNAYRAFSDLAGTHRVSIRPQALVGAADIRAVRSILKPFSDFIQNVIGNSNAYRNALSDVARIAGKRVSVVDAKRDAGIKTVITAKVNEVNTLRGELTKVKRENIRLAGTVRSREAQIKAAEQKYKEVSNALSELKESIGVAKNYKPWRAGSEEARSRLYGKVTSVSKEYGYFVIDLGERSVVYQESNGKKVPISLKLTSGIELMIVRDATDKEKTDKLLTKPTFVTSSRIVKVGEKESVVELPAGAEVKVGDIVLYKAAK